MGEIKTTLKDLRETLESLASTKGCRWMADLALTQFQIIEGWIAEFWPMYKRDMEAQNEIQDRMRARIGTLTAALEEARELCKEIRGRLKADLDQGMSKHHKGTMGMLDAFIKLSATFTDKGKAAKEFRVDAHANAIGPGTADARPERKPEGDGEYIEGVGQVPYPDPPCEMCGGSECIPTSAPPGCEGEEGWTIDCPTCKEKKINPADDSPPRPGP